MGTMGNLIPFKKIVTWFRNVSRSLFKKDVDKIYSELLAHFRTIELDLISKIKEIKDSLTNCFKFAEDVRKDLEIKYINQKDDIIRLEKRVEELEKQILEIQEIKKLLASHLIKSKPDGVPDKIKGKPGRKPKKI